MTTWSCKSDDMKKSIIDVQGHRGCRGLHPENTLPSFVNAIDLRVNTLELDVVVSEDGYVVVSHEPWFGHEVTLSVDGQEVTAANEKEFNLYQMSYDDIARVDVGMKHHERFPKQKKYRVSKPKLSKVIEGVETYVSHQGLPKPKYNIEIKRKPIGDGTYHPAYNEFADLVVKTVTDGNVLDRVNLQSFDIETLEYLHEKYSDISLAYLVENQKDIIGSFSKLSFVPTIFSPDFTLITPELVTYCAEQNIKLIPWTVNEIEDMQNLIDMGVDGIISDYPDRLVTVARRNGVHKY